MLAKLAGLLGVIALVFGYYLFFFPAPSFQVESNQFFGIISFILGGMFLVSAFLARLINRSRSSMKDVSKTIPIATNVETGKARSTDQAKQQDNLRLKQQAFIQQQQLNKQSQDMFNQQREMAKKQQEEWRRQQEQQRRRQ